MASSTETLIPLIRERIVSAGMDVSALGEEKFAKLVDLYKVRIKTLSEFAVLTDCFFKDDFAVDAKGKRKYLDKKENIENLMVFAGRLEALEEFTCGNIENVCRDIAEKNGLKAAQIIHPTRMAISGKTGGAGLFEMMELLGKQRVIERMKGTHGVIPKSETTSSGA